MRRLGLNIPPHDSGPRITRHLHAMGSFFAAILLTGLLGGCVILDLKKQNLEIDKTGTIAAEPVGLSSAYPAYALLLSDNGTVTGAETIASDQIATFAVPLESQPTVLIFSDINRNKRFDRGEPAGVKRKTLPIPLDDPALGGRVLEIPISSGAANSLAGTQVPSGAGFSIPVALGEVASVKESRFTEAMGETGLWSPETSLRAGNLGLYFNEPFDPSKIPVVFVHGIGGSPSDFQKLIPALDRSKYQAWFFTYPSGFRLGKASTTLASMLNLVMKQKGVKTIHVVAHSMGGLVARDAILKLSSLRGGSPVRRFVSISTPWGGHAAAKQGVRALKYPVPSWIDMVPGSPFLTSLWKQKLPPGTRHYLICGFDTLRRPWLTLNNDTVIDLSSSFFVPAQEESTRVFALPLSHEAILSSPVTFQKMNQYLNEP